MKKRLLVVSLLVLVTRTNTRTVDKSSEDLMGTGSQQSSKKGGSGFRWEAENWGPCFAGIGANGCGQGVRERSIWCQDSEGRKVLEFSCDGSSEPEKTKPCFIACRHHKDKLKWEVGPWGPCLEAENKMDLTFNTLNQKQSSDIKENYGLMQRNVSCILTSHDDVKLRMVVDEDNCFTVARKPDPVRLCSIPKPQDCVVTEFFGWSSCRTCQPHANQTRIRNVIVAPKNGGRPCPELSETRPCRYRKAECHTRSSSESRNEYRLKLGAWRKCEAPNSFVSADEIEYRLSRQNHLHPDRHSILPMLDSSSSAESSEKPTIFQPQVGYQTREILCKDSKGAVVDMSRCHKKTEAMPLRLRSCVVSQDCVVSDWSAWIKLQDGCTEESGLVRSEVHERKRQVIRLPEGNGQPCPHLVEKKETSNKESLPLCKHKYKRMPSKWSDCVVTSGSELVKVGCGGGIQLRTISCVMTSSRQPVEDSNCAMLEESQLPTVQRCEVACHRDCVIGDWGPWGPCVRGPCYKNSTTPVRGYRERKRTILVQPSSKGLSCPSTTEVQHCNEVHCFHWSISHWGICVLDTPGKCGLGTRKRSVKCVDSFGANVESSYCSYEEQPPEEEPCLLPCPFDCVLSPWSEWSPCSHSCSGPKMIALRQRNRTVIAPPGPGGHKCPNPDELLQMEPCNTHSCHGYSWLSLPWQPCKSDEVTNPPYYYKSKKTEYLNPSTLMDMMSKNTSLNEVEDFGEDEEEVEKTCGKGIRTREVWCVENSGVRVMDSKCHPLLKPVTSEPCVKECPVNCQLSPWSEWSSCPQECVPDASNEVKDGETAPTQSRSRVILKNPTNGGSTCGHLEELRPCPLSAARCKHYQWQLTNWSDCHLPENLKCGQGYRTRGIWCSRNHRTTKVSPTLCMETAGPPPSLSESCAVDCKHFCVLTEWSSWSTCTSSCRGQSVRSRQLIGLSSTRPQCLNNDMFPLKESKPCPCELYSATPDGEWSDCILESPVEKVTANGRVAHGMCGSGVRYKKNVCMNASGQIVEPSFCELESSLLEEACIVPCPVDCVQSSWSTWGECSSLCGPGFQNRSREIIQEPRENGRPCGQSVEIKICNTPCSNFAWISSGYTQCSLIRHDETHGCGTGNQYRSIRCMDYSQGGVAVQVKDEYCDPVAKPDDASVCHVSCPGDCVVSPWSAWSDCDKPCDSSKQRQRTRLLLRAPSHIDATATECPRLIQVQNCQINVTCFSYDWKYSDYGSCLPLGGSPCGEGVQTRAVYCERSDGRAVDESFCDSESKPTPPEKWCYLGCPVDCELSSWSSWNSSECKCGSSNGFEHRSRKIVTTPSDTGRPCPSHLKQIRPCPVVPCYSWIRGNWSSCKLEGASCGHGTVYRNISCLRDGIKVDSTYCLSQKDGIPESNINDIELVKLDLNTEASCYLPCHGDCEVSEWSKWSHCHRNCQDNPTGGYQTRSRAVLKKSSYGGEPCPNALWETKPCHSAICLTFQWTIQNNELICKRSDGLITLGGCDENKKPCLKNCSSVKGSVCFAGFCSCPEGYLSLYESEANQQLIECVATSENKSNRQKLSHSATMTDDDDMMKSRLLYHPSDEFNIWMFAMIGIGCLFIVFVAVSMYLMCHNSNSNNQENRTQMLNIAKP